MSRQKKSMMNLASLMCFVAVTVFVPSINVAGDLEPKAPPGPTMKTLDEIYHKPVWGFFDKEFVDWSSNPRFAVCDDGNLGNPNDDLVLDKETGLIWARNPNYLLSEPNEFTWELALRYCRNLHLGNRGGWKLPTVEELGTLVGQGGSPPLCFPTGHPFIINNYNYWTSTKDTTSDMAAFLDISVGLSYLSHKDNMLSVWPVRGGSSSVTSSW